MQHRIFLAPLKPGVAYADAHGHWCGHHAQLMLGMPGLLGYVQNRPLAEWWPHVGYLACSETWFAGREAERDGFGSAWYREEIVADELRAFARDAAWSSPVTGVEILHPGPGGGYRALSFGGRPDHLQGVIADARVELLRLARRPPGMDDAVVVVASTDDPGKAGLLARRLGGLAFAAQTEAVVPPPAP